LVVLYGQTLSSQGNVSFLETLQVHHPAHKVHSEPQPEPDTSSSHPRTLFPVFH